MQSESNIGPSVRGRPKFTATRWSLVLAAQGDDTVQAASALAELCRIYWYPLYAFVRRMGRTPEEAEDLTQEFFGRVIERSYFDAAVQAKGRFRAFLLTAFRHFLANEWDKARAQKRGGGATILSIDQQMAEERFDLEPADPATPEMLFERQWALTVIEQSLGRLEQELAAEGKNEWFDALKSSLTLQDQQMSHAELAARMGMSESAVKVTLHRLRKRYRALLRETIAQTVASPDEVDEEIRHLFKIFSS
jgi:RNA polymerase sigma factor (sigma-70 family)